jgi:diguanylate cyclase (GGDEF)-like protein
VMLMLVNCIGAISCYQLEYTTRLSYVESLELEELTKELKELAEVDGLTGLNNRRTYDAYIDRLWRQCQREQTALVIAMIDVDEFKPYNDQYGHQCGDDALIAVAGVIAAHANRPLDFAARYGGEEFVLALYGPHEEPGQASPERSVREYLEALRMAVMDLRIEHAASMTNKCLTVSVGAAIVYPGCSKRSLEGIVQMADEALYMAKEQGRNRVVVRTDDENFSTGVFRAINNSAA